MYNNVNSELGLNRYNHTTIFSGNLIIQREKQKFADRKGKDQAAGTKDQSLISLPTPACIWSVGRGKIMQWKIRT